MKHYSQKSNDDYIISKLLTVFFKKKNNKFWSQFSKDFNLSIYFRSRNSRGQKPSRI